MNISVKSDQMPDDVNITSELEKRVPGPRDLLKEKLAIHELASRMAEASSDILPRFVDLAMELTGSVAAGFSLYEPEPAPGIFRWQYLRGTMASADKLATPVDHSASAVAIERSGPILMRHPERFFSWMVQAGIAVPEVLLVPLPLEGDKALGSLWIVSDREGYFDNGHAQAISELASFAGIAVRMLRSEERLQNALVEQELIAHEMVHRLGNLLAVAESMVRISAGEAGSVDEMRQMLSGRLHALGRANALLGKRPLWRDEEQHVDFRQLLETILHPHESPVSPGARFSLSGQTFECGASAATGIALVIHELATNAAKYGALSVSGGHVDISWQQSDDMLELVWKESGRSAPEKIPSGKGFGSTLLEKTVTRQFSGSMQHDWQPGGLELTLTLSSASLAI